MSDLPYILKGMNELNTSDGTAFTVNIYRGKKKIGTIENDGRGGADMVWIDQAEQAAWSAWCKSLEPFRSAPTTDFPEGLVLNHPEESAVAYLMQVFEDAEEARWLDRQSKTKIVAVANAASERQYTLVNYNKGEGPTGTKVLLPQLFSDFPKIQKVWIVGEGWVQRS